MINFINRERNRIAISIYLSIYLSSYCCTDNTTALDPLEFPRASERARERKRECVFFPRSKSSSPARVFYRRCEGRAHSPASRVLDGIGLIRGGNVPDLLLKPLENSARPGDTGRSNSIEWHARFRPLKKETKTNLTDRTERPICIPQIHFHVYIVPGVLSIRTYFRPFRNALSRRNSLSREYFGRK